MNIQISNITCLDFCNKYIESPIKPLIVVWMQIADIVIFVFMSLWFKTTTPSILDKKKESKYDLPKIKHYSNVSIHTTP